MNYWKFTVNAFPAPDPRRYPAWMNLLWIMYALLCWQYATERMLYQDSAYALFRISNLHNTIEHGRWSIAPFLAPAYLGAWLGVPMAALIKIISVTPALFAWLASQIMIRRFGSRDAATVLLLALVCSGPEYFYLGIAEMTPALIYGTLFWASVNSEEYSWKSSVFSIFMLICSLLSHPGILPFLLMACVWIYIASGKRSWIWGMILLALVAAKRFLLPATGYEAEIMSRLGMDQLQNIGTSFGWHYFVTSLKSYLLWPALLFAWWMLTPGTQSVRSKLLTAGAAGAGLLMLLILFGVGDSNMMMEKNFLPWQAALLVPVFAMGNSEEQIAAPKSLFTGIVLLFAVWNGYSRKMEEGKFYTERLQRMEQLMKRGDIRTCEKQLLPAAMASEQEWRVTWAVPYESALLSSGRSDMPCKTIRFATELPDRSWLNRSDVFLGADFAYPLLQQQLNQRYYPFENRTPYCIFRRDSH